MPLVFRNETERVERRVRKDRGNFQRSRSKHLIKEINHASQCREDRSAIPRFLLDSSWEHHSHCYFLDQFTLPTEPDGSPGPLDSVPLLYSLAKGGYDNAPRVSLRAAIDAAAFTSLANRMKLPGLAIQARRKYGQALSELNSSLSSVQDAVRDETLGAIVMLMLFEDINSERNSLMSVHISGIQYLLKLRGPAQLVDPATRSLFHFAFTQMIIQFMGLKDPMQIDLDWLLEVLTIPHPIYNMMASNIKISKFCAAASQMLDQYDMRDPLEPFPLTSLLGLLRLGQNLDLEFNRWHFGLPEEWLPRPFQSQSGEPNLLYPDATSPGVWNYYRSTRIILQQTLIELTHRLKSYVLDDSPKDPLFAYTSAIGLHEDVIRRMIAEICQSIPFALGDVDIDGAPVVRSDGGQAGIKAIQGFALLWPVFSVPQSGYASEDQEAQAKSALQRIASSHGIRLGMDLSCETEQVGIMVRSSASLSPSSVSPTSNRT